MSNAMKTVSCPKCSGSGQIEAFGHYAQGRCFDCGGAGWLEASKLTRSAKQIAQTLAWHTIGALEEAAADGVNNPTWITHMCKRAAKDMLAMQNTEIARKMLARVPTYRAEIIALGRAS